MARLVEGATQWELAVNNFPTVGSYPPEGLPWSLFPEQPGGLFWEWNKPVLDWLNTRARDFEAMVAEASPASFIDTIDFARPCRDQEGTLFLVKELRVAYTQERVSAPRLTGTVL